MSAAITFVRPRGLSTGRAAATWAVLVVTTAIALFPMYWLFVNALTPITATPPLTPILWPAWKLDNIIRLLTTSKHYTQWASNSLVVALGATLWHANIGRVNNGPISYELDGKQYVLIAGGNSLYAFALP